MTILDDGQGPGRPAAATRPGARSRASRLGRHALSAVALLAILQVAGCGSGADRQIPLGAYVPVTRPLVSTEQVVPPTAHDHATLGLGWPGSLLATVPGSIDDADEAAAPEDGTWRIRGRVATFTFQLAVPGSLTLATEIRAQGDREDPEQTLELIVNGIPVAQRRLSPRWSVEELDIPPQALRVGVNEARLEFAMALRPDGAPHGAPPVPARVRWLRLASSEQRPPWPEPPRGVRILPGDEGADAPPGIAMRTDSLLELAVPAPPAARLRGALEVERARGNRRGRIHASVEAGPGAEDVAEVFRATFEVGGAERRSVDVALPAAEDAATLLRLRVWGSANGVVRWHGIRVEHGGRPVPDPLGDPEGELRPVRPRGGLVRGAADAPRGGRPDIVVILLDAARADAFSPYGAPTPTPATAALAEAGTRVARAVAPSSWTEPSVPSLLTGLYPDVHGVEIWNWPLPQEIVTLPEILADAGYRTVLWSHHLLWRGNRSLHQGFEIVETVPHQERHALPDAALLVDDERPTFALVHLLLPHAPYDPPPPFRGRHVDAGVDLDVSPRALGAFRGRFGTREPTPELIAHARGRYTEMVAWADAQVGSLIDGLRQLGRYEDALVVLTSDHGEGFYEHGEFLHSRFLYDEVLRVPLILKWPARARGLEPLLPGPASLVDLAPTLVDGLGLRVEGRGFQGRSLLGSMRGGAESGSRTVYSVTRVTELAGQPPRPQVALERDGLKAILDEPTGRLELYDLRSDPAETRNLVDLRPLAAAEMLQALLAHRRRHALLHARHEAARSAFRMDDELLEGLRALGYIH